MMSRLYPLRVSSLGEREQFYKNDFRKSLRRINDWFREIFFHPQFIAVDPGSDTGISRDNKRGQRLLIFRADTNMAGLFERIAPEDVYYDRNHYRNPSNVAKRGLFREALERNLATAQELVFDIDAENMNCPAHKKDKVCELCINASQNQAFSLKNYLEAEHSMESRVVFSGRGFHVHVDKRFSAMGFDEREELNNELMKYFAIDPWVSRGRIRLIRMPFSLNALVSRIVVPLTGEERIRVHSSKEIMPSFLERKPYKSAITPG